MKTKTLQTYHTHLHSGHHSIQLEAETYFPQQYCEPVQKIACDAHYGEAIWKDRRVLTCSVKEHRPELGEAPPDPLFGSKIKSWDMYIWIEQSNKTNENLRAKN